MSALLCHKVFLRRSDTARSILAIALLVAMLTSASSIVSFLNAQVESLASLRYPAGRYIIMRGDSAGECGLDIQLLDSLSSIQYLDSIIAESLFWSSVTAGSTRIEAPVRGVSDVEKFLSARGARLSGSVARSAGEAVVGWIVAEACSIGVGEEVLLTRGAKSASVVVVGIFRAQSEIDSEIVVPMEAALNLAGGCVSLIEFSLRGGASAEGALAELSMALPEGARIVQAQQPVLFAQQVNAQLLNFLSFWSLVVCAVVASASYVIAARLVEESSYEILMLRALGVGRARLFALIMLYIATVAALGSILGMSIGLAGVQVTSTVLSWLTPSMRITPMLELRQVAWILSATLLSSTIGCLAPAYGATKVRYTEKLL
ncbi:MAG: ABC transporter permease [Candidatus Nezhaarchaeales archaeon]